MAGLILATQCGARVQTVLVDVPDPVTTSRRTWYAVIPEGSDWRVHVCAPRLHPVTPRAA